VKEQVCIVQMKPLHNLLLGLNRYENTDFR
jgi:hypothetical protein